MIEYSTRYEGLIVAWYYDLKADPVEFENLFDEPLRHLSTFLTFIEQRVKFVFQYDDDGIKYAAWIEPWMSGAFWGFWSRKDQRRGIGQVAFVHRVIQRALAAYPLIIGITRRPELRAVHLALGFTEGCTLPFLFDKHNAFVYLCTQESYGRRRRKIHKHEHQLADESVLGPASAIREVGTAGVPTTGEPDRGSKPHRRRKRGNPADKQLGGRVARGSLNGANGDGGIAGEGGPRE